MIALKNAIKRLKFFVAKLTSSKRCYVTCTGMTDGAGAQVQAVMSTQLFAHDMGMTYVHTPFNNIYYSHGREDELEDYFGLGSGELQARTLPLETKKIKRLKWLFKSNVVYSIPHCHEYADLYPHKYTLLKDGFRSKFLKNKQINDGRCDCLSIVTHIRRGDVSTSKHSERYTDIDKVNLILSKVKKIAASKGLVCKLTVVSQGRVEDFCDIDFDEVEFHLDTDLKDAFLDLTSADVLVMAKSSMSYCTAVYSNAVVMYERFWHTPLPDWIDIDQDDRLIEEIISKKYECGQKKVTQNENL
ncbi:MAG: hypothetical protein RPU64_13810 [Candidatus Sedimenticola sp. (ex Thyasira tokunagai)]